MDHQLLNVAENFKDLQEIKWKCFVLRVKVNDSIASLSTANAVSNDFLLSACADLDQLSFKNVVEERTLNSICGYPLCCQPLSAVPSQHYVIRRNKLYDISGRKCYCSDQCFECANFLLNQLPACPLWLKPDDQRSSIHILPRHCAKGKPGDEVPLAPSEIIQAMKGLQLHSGDTDKHSKKLIVELPSQSNAAEQSLMSSVDQACAEESGSETAEDSCCSSSDDELCIEEISSCSQGNSLRSRTSRPPFTKPRQQSDLVLSSIRERYFVKKGNYFTPKKPTVAMVEPKPMLTQSARVVNAEVPKLPTLEQITEFHEALGNINSWFSDESLRFVCDVSEMKNQEASAEEEPKFSDAHKKIMSFLFGTTEANDCKEEGTRASDTFLPVVDSQQQLVYRQQLLLKQLNNVLPSLLALLGVNCSIVTEDLSRFIQTFRLNANNVHLKPKQCRIAGCVILMLLCHRKQNLPTYEEVSQHSTRLIDKFTISVCLDFVKQFLERACNANKHCIDE